MSTWGWKSDEQCYCYCSRYNLITVNTLKFSCCIILYIYTNFSFSLVPTVSVQVVENISPTLGQSGYSLICNITGELTDPAFVNPFINYRWTKKNDTTQTPIQVGVGSVLSFSSLRLSDAGQYTCQVMISSSYLNTITVNDSHDITYLSEFFVAV